MKALLITLVALAPFTSQAAETIANRTYQMKLQTGGVKCGEPLPPNGHNYPVYTRLTLPFPSYELWTSGVWTNVNEYTGDVGYKACKEFAKLTTPGSEVIATVNQVTTEEHHLTQAGDCLRETRETATLTVEGTTFRATEVFLVGPLDSKRCQ